MKLKREKLVRHLEKISCRGQVKEVVFTKGFATQALTPDHHLLVLAPSLKGVEPLGTDIGIANLDGLIKAFGTAKGEGSEATDVTVLLEDNRLVIYEEEAGAKGSRVTASPKTIGTRVEDKTVASLKAKVGEDGIDLTQSLIEAIQKAFTDVKATEIEITVGPKGGKVRVGNEDSDFWEFAREDLTADEEYSLVFAEHFVDVLSIITDFSSAKLILGGPGTLIAIKDGNYTYLLGPRSRSADEAPKKAKATTKAKAKAKAKKVEQEEEAETVGAGAEDE